MIRLAALALAFTATFAGAAPGSLDPTFGTGGIATIFPHGPYPYTRTGGLEARDDGGATMMIRTNEPVIMHILADGTLDTSYGEQGYARPGLTTAYIANAGAKVYAVGSIQSVSGADTGAIALSRLDESGNLDAAFAGGQIPVPSAFFGAIVDRALGVAVDTQGRAVVAIAGQSGEFAFSRFLANGTRDSSFGTNGVVTVSPGFEAFRLDGDRIVMAYFTGGVAKLTRLSPNGSPDLSFGVAGHAELAHDFSGPVLMSVASGFIYLYSSFDRTVARIGSTGSIDPSFGSSGYASTSLLVNLNSVDSLVATPQRIYVTGHEVFGQHAPILALRPDGTPDTTFGTQGVALPVANPFASIGIVASLAIGPTSVFLGLSDGNNSPIPATVRRMDLAGTVTWSVSPTVESRTSIAGYAAAMQPDGKMVIAGRRGFRGMLARVNGDGSLDTSFGTDGFTELEDVPFSIVLRPDGTIVTAGRWTTYFTPSGGYDPARAANQGACYIGFDPQGQSYVSDAALTADGKMIVVGTVNVGSEWDFLVSRVMPDCGLDPTFGTAGRVRVHLGSSSEFRAVAIQPDGRILAAGSTFRSDAAPLAFAGVVMRFLADGEIDETYGDFGTAIVATPTASDTYLSSIALYADGRMAFGGASWAHQDLNTTARFLVGRLLADGQPDASFNGGLAFAAPTPAGRNWVNSIALQPDGKLLAGGLSGRDPPTHMAVARFLPNGHLDTSFGSGGSVVTPAQYSSAIEKLFLRPGGKLQAAGASKRLGDWYSFAAARYDLGAMEYAGNDNLDFNADARPDIIWSNTANGATYLWYMNGIALGIDAFITQIDPSWKIQGVADFNGDGHPDLVWRNTATGSTYVWYMNFSALISDAPLFNLPPEWVIQGVADFNGDGKPDFLLRNTTTGVAFVWFFNDATPIGDQFLFGIDPQWKVEGVADMNGDGQPDLLFRNMASGLAFAWNTQYSGGTLSLTSSSAPIFGIDPVWEIVQMADWNGDGSPDLLFRNRDTGLVFVWYMNGTTLGGSDFITQIDPSWEIVPRR